MEQLVGMSKSKGEKIQNKNPPNDEVQNTVKSLVICLNCYQKSPYLRDQVPMGTHFTVLLPMGSLFTFQGPYFEWVWGEQLNLIFQIDCQQDFYSPLQIY